MDGFPLPVFNIESEDDEEEQQQQQLLHHAVVEESPEIKASKKEHLYKLLADRSLTSQSNSHNAILKKLEGVAEDNLLKKDLKETVPFLLHCAFHKVEHTKDLFSCFSCYRAALFLAILDLLS